jgi:UbiD family decarboxylase
MADRDLRQWMTLLEEKGDLKRVQARVDWDDEISQIIRRTYQMDGPALLFDNIKDHEKTFCKKLFTGSFGSQRRLNYMVGLPAGTPPLETIQEIRRRMKHPLPPVEVKTGAVKENICKGKDIDLFQIPVPKWHPLDGGRYINTFFGAVTRDPDSQLNNVGIYRGMILDRNRIGVLLIPMKDWGITYTRYQEMNKPMPVAFVYGIDPTLEAVAGIPVTGQEYDLAGAMQGQALELVRCETSDIVVPASAEMVIEGTISPDTATYAMEGPVGEGSGYYGEARRRPVVEVNCITFRNDPIYRGGLVGCGEAVQDEIKNLLGTMMSVATWNFLENQEIPGILDVMIGLISAVKIHKTYQGQARQIGAALWGSKFAGHHHNTVVVVEEDVDIRNPMALLAAIHDKADIMRDFVAYPLNIGSPIDVSVSYDLRDELKYGASIQNKLLIDATTDWQTNPVRSEWGNRRFPPSCVNSRPETIDLVEKRWNEYNI